MKTTTAIQTSIAATFGLVSASLNGQTFFDGTMNNNDWIAAEVYDSTAGQSATFAAGQILSNGNPGSFRSVTHDFGGGRLIVGHLNIGGIYTPSIQGPITSVSFSYELRTSEGVQGMFAYGLVYQAGTYFSAPSFSFADVTWSSVSESGLTFLDLTSLDGSSHPDFSEFGAPIQFGFFTDSSQLFLGGHSEIGIDNWTITVVPEPSTYALLLCGLLGLTSLRKWRAW